MAGIGAGAPEVPRPRDLARAEQQFADQGIDPPSTLQGPSRPLHMIAEAESVSSGAAAEHQTEGAAAQVIQTAGQTGAANGERQAVTPVHDSQAGQRNTETAEAMFRIFQCLNGHWQVCLHPHFRRHHPHRHRDRCLVDCDGCKA